jgi:DNA (cytosine-5)-methyltransferase 1
MKPQENKIRVVDFFSGAGGWSEGLRQQGFKIVMGFDNWAPAVKTHNLNHGLNDEPMDILDFEDCDTKHIDEVIPDSEIIVGSPPCVSFSMSNKAGKADKTLGIRLIESYLRVVAYKKHKEGKCLKAWYMENVPNSKNYVKPEYTFADLKLGTFAKSIGKKPKEIALRGSHPENGGILCAADYGSPQKRERFVCGEILVGKDKGKFLAPKMTHEGGFVTLDDIKGKLPTPFSARNDKPIVDPNYPNLSVPLSKVTDHFYDTGVYQVEWEAAKRAKVDHPFMGRMSFPEDGNRPSRTIMATRSASTREAILYKSEVSRHGDGEYRLPTIREASCLMGFPLTYQFYGTESVKWRQIGNAVCPHMSAAVGKGLRKALGLTPLRKPIFETDIEPINNLNTFGTVAFDDPPGKKEDSKYRRHPFKTGNMTVALINFDPRNKNAPVGKTWHACAFVGSGKSYKPMIIGKKELATVKTLVEDQAGGKKFVKSFESEFKGRIADHAKLQKMHVMNRDEEPHLKPDSLIEKIKEFVSAHAPDKEAVEYALLEKIIGRKRVPVRQLFSMYALASVADGV